MVEWSGMAAKPRIDWWNLSFTLFFVVLVIGAYQVLEEIPRSVGVWDALLMALASFRLTRLVVYDSITSWVRAFFEKSAPFTLMGSIKTLINCPWCVGLWAALVVATAFFAYPVLWFAIFVLALGGVASLVQLFANGVGWDAEYAKKQVIGE